MTALFKYANGGGNLPAIISIFEDNFKQLETLIVSNFSAFFSGGTVAGDTNFLSNVFLSGQSIYDVIADCMHEHPEYKANQEIIKRLDADSSKKGGFMRGGLFVPSITAKKIFIGEVDVLNAIENPKPTVFLKNGLNTYVTGTDTNPVVNIKDATLNWLVSTGGVTASTFCGEIDYKFIQNIPESIINGGGEEGQIPVFNAKNKITNSGITFKNSLLNINGAVKVKKVNINDTLSIESDANKTLFNTEDKPVYINEKTAICSKGLVTCSKFGKEFALYFAKEIDKVSQQDYRIFNENGDFTYEQYVNSEWVERFKIDAEGNIYMKGIAPKSKSILTIDETTGKIDSIPLMDLFS